MSKVIALDIGDVRIGVASSDLLGIIASPVEVIDRRQVNPVERIKIIVENLKANILVYGIPKSLDGTEKRQAEKVREFVSELKKVIENVEFAEFDERYSTVSADNMLKNFTKKDAKEKRKVVDKIAATIILQTYLDMKNKRRLQ